MGSCAGMIDQVIIEQTEARLPYPRMITFWAVLAKIFPVFSQVQRPNSISPRESYWRIRKPAASGRNGRQSASRATTSSEGVFLGVTDSQGVFRSNRPRDLGQLLNAAHERSAEFYDRTGRRGL